MIERELKDVSENVLRELIAEGASEGKTLEFKRSLDVIDVAAKPDAKLKFLRGIASFANASGGDMIFGMAANAEGKAESLIPLETFNPDRDTLRLRDIIRMNIEPGSVFVEFKPIDLSTGGHALVIRIRKSWAGAHLVTHNGDMRFFTRDHGGKRLMDVPEIRDAFTLAEGMAERINRFRLERISNIVAGETVEPLNLAGKVVLHLCPLSSFSSEKRCDLGLLQATGGLKLETFQPNVGSSFRHDVEGFYAFVPAGNRTTAMSYTLVSHSGWIEAVDSMWLQPNPQMARQGLEDIIPTDIVEPELVRLVASYFRVLKLIGADAPIVVMLSFLSVRGFKVHLQGMVSSHSERRIRRDHILIPGSVVETLEVQDADRNRVNAIDIMRPMFDVLWNACGLSKSWSFNADGDWKRRDRWS